MTALVDSAPETVLDRIARATDSHDLDALVDCFAPDYRNETPAHPDRGFVGREQIRKNWSQIFALVPDVTAKVLSYAVDGHTVWSEWEHRGTRPDGRPHVMRGVVILGVMDGRAIWARFYLEPVREGEGDADEAVRQVLKGDVS